MKDSNREPSHTDRNLLVESLRLIVQSQVVLADLQRNQKKLEELIRTLSDQPAGGDHNER